MTLVITVHTPSGGCVHDQARYLMQVAEQLQAGYIGGQEDDHHHWMMEEVDHGKAPAQAEEAQGR